MDESFIGKYLVEGILGIAASAFGYFYKRNEKARDDQMTSLQMQINKHQETINEKLVKKDDFVDLKNTLMGEFRYFRERLDEIADRK